MSGRLTSKIKIPGDLSVDYTVPAGKFTAGSLIVNSKGGTDNSISLLIQNANIDSTNFVDDSNRVPFNMSDYIDEFGDRSKLLISRAEGVQGLSDSDFVGEYSWTSDQTSYETPTDWGYPNGRFLVGRDSGHDDSQIFLWDGTDKIYEVTSMSTQAITAGAMIIAGLAATLAGSHINLTIAHGRGKNDVFVFYGAGKRAYLENFNFGVDTTANLVGTDTYSNRDPDFIESSYFTSHGDNLVNIFRNADGNVQVVQWADNDFGTTPVTDKIFTALGKCTGSWMHDIGAIKEADIYFATEENSIRVLDERDIRDGKDYDNIEFTGLNLGVSEKILYITPVTADLGAGERTHFVTTSENLFSYDLDVSDYSKGTTNELVWALEKPLAVIASIVLSADDLYGSKGTYVETQMDITEDRELFAKDEDLSTLLGYYQANDDDWYYEDSSLIAMANTTALYVKYFDDELVINGMLFASDDAVIISCDKTVEFSIIGIEQFG